MAVLRPLFINQVEYDAESERRGFAGLVAAGSGGVARTGVLGAAPAVSLSGSSVQVGPFNAAIGTAKGVYLTGLDSVTAAAGSVAPADATNGRLDRVVLEVPTDPVPPATEPAYLGRLRVIGGTAAAIPALPALPANALHVAQVQVPRSGAGNPTVIIDAPLTAAAGAPVPVRSEAERATLPLVNGLRALRLDTPGRDVDVCTGSAWIPGGSTKQTLPLHTLYSADPPREDGLPQEAPSFYRAGRRVHLSGVASNNSTIAYLGGTAYLLGSLPAGFRPQFPEYFNLEVAFTPCRVWVRPDGQIFYMFPNSIGSLGGRVAKFSLSGISFDAAP